MEGKQKEKESSVELLVALWKSRPAGVSFDPD